MVTQTVTANSSTVGASPDDTFLLEYQAREALFRAQPISVQRAFELQSCLIASAVLERQSPLRFILPELVVCKPDGSDHPSLETVPLHHREQKIGGIFDHLKTSDVSYHLKYLESSPDKTVSTCGRLIRHTVARHLVYRMLPLPQHTRNHQHLLTVHALDFFMPQWVAFDNQDNLLVNSLYDAQSCITASQNYLSILKIAVGLAPYFIFDKEYQRKRIGMLAQLMNQGQALARHETASIIEKIKRRVAENSLNRGFDLDLPFFDDQALEMRKLNIPVIPHGRIQFVPAFVVIAARVKQMEVEHSPGLSHTTRKHLLEELNTLLEAFDDLAD